VSSWNYAEVWRQLAEIQGDAVAIEQGSRSVSWREFDQASRSLASWMRQQGVADEAKVALYLHNCPEYLVGFAAALFNKSIPVNTNYRYGVDELVYLFENADAEVLIFHGTFTSVVDSLRTELPQLRHYLFVDDHTAPCPSWATPFDDAASTPIGELPQLSGDDMIFLYTGGTTGMPKGVMWRQDDLFARLNSGGFRRFDEESNAQVLAEVVLSDGPGYSVLPACPLMHGTGLFTAINALGGGGRVVLLPSRHFSADELALVIDDHDVNVVVIVGDPFARPLLRCLEANPDRYSLKSVFAFLSSGAMWSEEIKRGLLNFQPEMMLVDAFSSSEALGMGSSVSSGQAMEQTARFTLGADVRVISDAGTDVAAGSQEIGRLILGGRIPLGYYKDEAKSAATFQVVNGVRYSVPGDMAMVNSDGTIHLLGRGSQCINTAGEKVFPEEVEETLKTHPAVADACVVGVADQEYGQRIVAAVELHPGRHADEVELIAHVKTRLASYKAPRAIRTVDSIGRAVNGKMDYARHQSEAAQWDHERTVR
jgi:acyl-CoA synthetase (AMP-forming)/AMP-acid ligase II